VVNAAGTRTTYTWDMADRVAGIALSGGALITMAYSATGLRRVRQDGSGTVKYLWDGQSPLMETDGDGTTTARYTGATDPYGAIVSQRRGSTSRFFHANDLGTFDTVTDADAATTDTYILDAWGVQRASTGSTTNPFRYIGALGYYTEPDLALAYVRARWLRPATGSWLSVDPVEGEMRYGYVGGRVTAVTDTLGRQPRRPTKPYDFAIVPWETGPPDPKDLPKWPTVPFMPIWEVPSARTNQMVPDPPCATIFDEQQGILVECWPGLAGDCRLPCLIEHEMEQIRNTMRCFQLYQVCLADDTRDPARCAREWWDWIDSNRAIFECHAFKAQLQCLEDMVAAGGLSPECLETVTDYIEKLRRDMRDHGFDPDAPCPDIPPCPSYLARG
jgi:RHS repeat-associated protein